MERTFGVGESVLATTRQKHYTMACMRGHRLQSLEVHVELPTEGFELRNKAKRHGVGFNCRVEREKTKT